MSTELTHPTTTLTDQMEFARAVTSTGAGSILPESYRNNPSNVLIAVGLGQSMGLSPAESLYRIAVIKGKPTASAELIAANVRRAGHRLRVAGNEHTATATIVRADDPEFEFTVTRDLEWAKSMGLAANDNYKKQPGTMLQWRAISACARLACPEALYGITYTPDEMAEVAPKPEPVTLATLRVIPDPAPPTVPDDATAEQNERIGELAADLTPEQEVQAAEWASHGVTRDLYALTTDEAAKVIAWLEQKR